MNKILIEDIEKEVNATLFYEFNEFMEEFDADIHADLTLKSIGQFIEISGTAQGKLKLTNKLPLLGRIPPVSKLKFADAYSAAVAGRMLST